MFCLPATKRAIVVSAVEITPARQPIPRRLIDARRVPPGARSLRQGPVNVFAGPTAEAKARLLPRATLALPDGHDPHAYRWPVAGRDVTVSWPNGPLRDVRRLFDALVNDGAERVVVVAPLYYDSAQAEPWRWEA
jgi:hypothetical protein